MRIWEYGVQEAGGWDVSTAPATIPDSLRIVTTEKFAALQAQCSGDQVALWPVEEPHMVKAFLTISTEPLRAA